MSEIILSDAVKRAYRGHYNLTKERPLLDHMTALTAAIAQWETEHPRLLPLPETMEDLACFLEGAYWGGVKHSLVARAILARYGQKPSVDVQALEKAAYERGVASVPKPLTSPELSDAEAMKLQNIYDQTYNEVDGTSYESEIAAIRALAAEFTRPPAAVPPEFMELLAAVQHFTKTDGQTDAQWSTYYLPVLVARDACNALVAPTPTPLEQAKKAEAEALGKVQYGMTLTVEVNLYAMAASGWGKQNDK